MSLLRISRVGYVPATLCLLAMLPKAAPAATLGQTDEFQSGTTLNWDSFASPTHIANGGPAGTGDGFLQISTSGFHLGVNNKSQWTGDYRTAGIGAIQIDAKHLAPFVDAVSLRLVLFGGGGSFSTLVPIPISDDGWNTYEFILSEANMVHLTGGTGLLRDTLANVTTLLLRQDTANPPSRPGNHVDHISATLGIDNITTVAVPEPSSLVLLAMGFFYLLLQSKPCDLTQLQTATSVHSAIMD